MVQRRTSSLTLKATVPGRERVGRPDLRDYSSFKNPGARPSIEFDWDAALIRFAHSMRNLGYDLSIKQQQRIDDHA